MRLSYGGSVTTGNRDASFQYLQNPDIKCQVEPGIRDGDMLSRAAQAPRLDPGSPASPGLCSGIWELRISESTFSRGHGEARVRSRRLPGARSRSVTPST